MNVSGFVFFQDGYGRSRSDGVIQRASHCSVLRFPGVLRRSVVFRPISLLLSVYAAHAHTVRVDFGSAAA